MLINTFVVYIWFLFFRGHKFYDNEKLVTTGGSHFRIIICY